MTTDRGIERWTELVAAEGRGRRLTDLEQTFRAQIERERPELATEAPVWHALGEQGGSPGRGSARPPRSSISDEEMCAAALAAAPVATVTPRRAARGLGPALALAAGVTLAVGLYALLRDPTGSPSRADPAAVPSAAPMIRAVLPPSRVQTMLPGARTRLAPASCVRVTDDLEVCARTAALVERLAGDDEIGLRLFAGEIDVLAADEPRRVAVATSAGTVWGVNAVFSVAQAQARTRVLVRTGEVDVPDAGLRELVAAGMTRDLVAPPATVDLQRAPSPPPPAVESPEALLEGAQRRLTAGETGQAIVAYEALLRHHPRSIEAHTALVSLGNLLLLRGRPARALRYFDRYLARGGELSEEALYGRIHALQREGRVAEAREAGAQFLARHADSLYAPRVRALTAAGG